MCCCEPGSNEVGGVEQRGGGPEGEVVVVVEVVEIRSDGRNDGGGLGEGLTIEDM